jgi:hypothetical protein
MRRAPEARKIDQFDDGTVLHMCEHSAGLTPRPTSPQFDVDAQRLSGDIVDTEHVHIRQADK